MQEIEITFNEDGTMKIDAKGFKGQGCITELKKLQKALEDLGIKTDITDQKLKPEYYEAHQLGKTNIQSR